MKSALMQTLRNLAGSRKAMLAITGAIAAGAMRLGFDVDKETVLIVLTPILMAIGSQAVEDAKKKPDVKAVP